VPLVVPLVDLTAFFVALGLCIIAIYFVRALFGTAGSVVGWIPWVGSKIQGSLHTIEQKITNELGKVVAGLDAGISWSWYQLAHLGEWMANEIKRNASTVLALAGLVTSPLSIPAWRSLWMRLNGRVDVIPHAVKATIAAAARPLGARLARLEAWTHARIRVLSHAIDVTLPHDIAGLRKQSRTAERTAENAWKWIKSHERLFGGLAFAGLVAAALGRLGAGWVRCRNWERIGKQVCATDPSVIEDLLAGVLLLAGTFSIVEFVRDAQAVEGAAIDSFAAVIREFPAP
jgi:hypothetical protein